MPRPGAKAKGSVDVTSLLARDGADLTVNIESKPAETPAEIKHRLRKDFLSFVVKDLLSYVLVFVTLLVGISYAGYVLFAKSPAEKDEKQWAMTVLSSILGGVVGLIFGKATK